ncbi:class I SAM-dependent methyltransferase [Hymenobacter sp. BT175]|uniref:class I SAM-dependent methyltransferase n=1 Tax=Hymenobacter translucens TaxID=2886507 RepID=UPI001D0F25D6|nr:class I SAM-dependent methyltransferase [Hymenobacter translucens]MCC2548141.1 class I SAM-dependent methyltransferase [Hymenobacter translucens]
MLFSPNNLFLRRLPGRLKYVFLRFGLHNLLGWIFFPMFWLSRMTQLGAWVARHRQVPFNDFPSAVFNYQKRYELYKFVLEREKLDGPISYLEFGVAAGDSFRWWAAQNQHPDSRFHGFDTFTGLPEDWGLFKKGDMSTGKQIPEMNDARCQFYAGLFQQTLPSFLRSTPLTHRRVIHLDADLFTATLYVLTSLHPYLQSGDILLFDEFNVPTHEFSAFTDYCRSFYVQTEVLAAVNNYYQVAFRVL